jgi:hypothetical protein
MHDHYGSPESHLRELLPLLETKGVKLLAAEYSGGNDEGGVQQITLYTTIVRDDDSFAQVEQLACVNIHDAVIGPDKIEPLGHEISS